MEAWGEKYVPAPSYRYRHRLYRRALRRIGTSPFLDIGAGRGDLALWLAGRGAAGVVLDPSPRAAAVLAAKLSPYPGVEVISQRWEDFTPSHTFALVMANEMLEHVDDDLRALVTAASWVRPDGHVLISVPAHRRQWGWRDEVKGHIRRYERSDLVGLLRAAGLTPLSFWSWGWPIINLLRWWDRNKSVRLTQTREEATASSAVTQDAPPVPSLLTREGLWAPAFSLMDLSLNTDWGVGYVVLAKPRGGGG